MTRTNYIIVSGWYWLGVWIAGFICGLAIGLWVTR